MGDKIDQVREDLKQAATDLIAVVRDQQALPGLSKDSREKIKTELEVMRRMLTTVHEPRFALVGDAEIDIRFLLNSLIEVELDDEDKRTTLGVGRWYPYETPAGVLHVLDVRDDVDQIEKASKFDSPDFVLCAIESGSEDVTKHVDDARRVLFESEDASDRTIPLIFITVRTETSGGNPADFRTVSAIRKAFVEAGLEQEFAPIISSVRTEKLAGELVKLAPDNAQLPLARILKNKKAKEAFADRIIELGTAVNTTIATVPIPIADVVPITTVQVLMTGAIAYTSGRPVNAKSLTEFAGAIGVNVGAGLAMRELVRALVQLIPVAGSFVSASIAASATYTLGKSAKKYFIVEPNS